VAMRSVLNNGAAHSRSSVPQETTLAIEIRLTRERHDRRIDC
jgi:hypothetical protein